MSEYLRTIMNYLANVAYKAIAWTLYGVRSRRTHLLGDQLWLADDRSWQIADRYATAS